MAYDAQIEQAAKQYNVDPALIRAVIGVESSGNPNAVSSAGAVGLGQLMPATAKNLGVNPANPVQNIQGSAKLLSQLLTQTGNNVPMALAAYHGGQNTANWGPQTMSYPGKVLNNVLPGVPVAPQAANTPPVADAFSAYTKTPAVASTSSPAKPATPVDAFSAYTKPVAQASSPSPGAAQPPSNPSAQQPAQDNAFGAPTGGNNFINAMGHNAGNLPLGIAQGVMHGLSGAESGLQGLLGGGTVLQQPTQALDQFIQQRENNYQTQVPTTPASVAGAITGNVVPFLGTGGAGLINAASDQGASLAARLGAGSLGQSVAAKAGGLLGNTGLGALAGAAAPVNDGGDYGQQKLQQTAIGGLVGAAAPPVLNALGGLGRYAGNVAGALTKPFSGSGQDAIAINALRQAANGGPTDINAAQLVPGSSPTLAEATGNPGIATLQRVMADRNPNSFMAQQQQNADARVGAVENAVGTPADLQAAQASRQTAVSDMNNAITNLSNVPPEVKSALQAPALQPILRQAEAEAVNTTGTNPFQSARDQALGNLSDRFSSIAGSPADIDTAKGQINDAVGDLYSSAKLQTLPVDKQLSSILQRPAVQSALGRAQTLANENGAGPIINSYVSTQQALQNGGSGLVQTIGGSGLHYLKMAMDDIASGKGTQGIAANEKQAVLNSQNDLLNWFDSKSPEYQQARQTYAQMIQPVSAMQYLQGLNVTDASGNIAPAKLDSAIKTIQTQQAQPGINPAKNITPQQLSSLQDLRDDALQITKTGVPDTVDGGALSYVNNQLQSTINSPTFTSLPTDQQQAINNASAQLTKWSGTQPQAANVANAYGQENQLSALQGLNLTDVNGNVTRSKVQTAITKLQNSGVKIDDSRMQALKAVRDDLDRQANIGLGKSAGSNTYQNFATDNLLQSAIPGRLGQMLSGLGSPAGATAGATIGSVMAGPPGAAVGGVLGNGISRLGAGLLKNQNQAIENKLINILLNPQQLGANALLAPTRAPITFGNQLNAPLANGAASLLNNRAMTR